MVVNGEYTGRYYLDLNKMKWISIVLILALTFSSGLAKAEQDDPARLKVNKTMLTNFMKSLIIPGWGQWSNGHKVRAVAYLTAEVAGLYGYQINKSGGDDKEIEFKHFADEHWSYVAWSGTDDGSTACGGFLRTHQMPTYVDGNSIIQPVKDHHFYENVSKYPEFVCGWDDIADRWDEEEKVFTPNKQEYIELRTLSNDLYKNAQVATTLVFVNHLISAIDAALGTDVTQFESTNYTGKFYINPLNATNSIRLEVKF